MQGKRYQKQTKYGADIKNHNGTFIRQQLKVKIM